MNKIIQVSFIININLKVYNNDKNNKKKKMKESH